MSEHVRQELLAWAERRLPPGDRARVDAHLRACRACQSEADDLLHLADMLGALPRALPAPEATMATLSGPYRPGSRPVAC